MNPQIRKLFTVILGLFTVLAAAVTFIQFVKGPDLVADPRNARRYIQLAERDRGPIIVADAPVAVSERQSGSDTYQRTYPQGPLYAAVTGYFSAVNLSATGMEAADNEILTGESSGLFWQRLRNMFAGKSRQGGGVVLTIDPAVQETAANWLGTAPGAAVVLDVPTGAVRALYSSPTFDPNPLASLDAAVAAETVEELEDDPDRPLENRAIASTRYAPGSVFKILTTVALLENGLTPKTKVEAPVTTTLPGTDTKISNFDEHECGDGKPTLTEAFARSCNTPFVIASKRLAPDDLEKVADRFGFGQALSIPLPVTPSSFPQDLDPAQLAMSAIGQFDVQVTPLQMAMVAQAIANDGKQMRPHLVERVVNADNKTTATTNPDVMGTPVDPKIASEIKTMMVQAVEEPYGTATSAGNTGFSVAAKTGTAEIGDGTQSNAWTVAFAPADDPQLAVAVLVESTDSDPAPQGGAVAAPIVRALLEAGLN